MNKQEINEAIEGYKRLKKLEERLDFLEQKLDNLAKYVEKQNMPLRYHDD